MVYYKKREAFCTGARILYGLSCAKVGYCILEPSDRSDQFHQTRKSSFLGLPPYVKKSLCRVGFSFPNKLHGR